LSDGVYCCCQSELVGARQEIGWVYPMGVEGPVSRVREEAGCSLSWDRYERCACALQMLMKGIDRPVMKCIVLNTINDSAQREQRFRSSSVFHVPFVMHE